MTSRSDRLPQRAAVAKRRPDPSGKSGHAGTLLGVFIGIAIGLTLAAVVAFYLLKTGNPYPSTGPAKEPAREGAKESTKVGRVDTGTAEKPRFDFYKILPGVEEPKIQPKATERAALDRSTADRAATPDKALAKAEEPTAPPVSGKQPRPAERFWLQAGSFANEADAENLKATLAFAGWVALVQQASLPDKSLRYRVRLGPFDNTDELARMKGELAKRGFDAAVIKF